jgi:hypothetical protein
LAFATHTVASHIGIPSGLGSGCHTPTRPAAADGDDCAHHHFASFVHSYGHLTLLFWEAETRVAEFDRPAAGATQPRPNPKKKPRNQKIPGL